MVRKWSESEQKKKNDGECLKRDKQKPNWEQSIMFELGTRIKIHTIYDGGEKSQQVLWWLTECNILE